MLKIHVPKNFGYETRWNITFLRGFFCLKSADFPQTPQNGPNQYFSKSLVHSTRTFGAFCPFIPCFAIGKWLFIAIPAGKGLELCSSCTQTHQRLWDPVWGAKVISFLPVQLELQNFTGISCKISRWASVEQHSHLQVTLHVGSELALSCSNDLLWRKEGKKPQIRQIQEFWKCSSSEKIFRKVMENNNF